MRVPAELSFGRQRDGVYPLLINDQAFARKARNAMRQFRHEWREIGIGKGAVDPAAAFRRVRVIVIGTEHNFERAASSHQRGKVLQPACAGGEQAHGEAKIQWLALASLVDGYAVTDGGHEGDLTWGGECNVTGFSDEVKNVSHVAMYASRPRELNGPFELRTDGIASALDPRAIPTPPQQVARLLKRLGDYVLEALSWRSGLSRNLFQHFLPVSVDGKFCPFPREAKSEELVSVIQSEAGELSTTLRLNA
jgi:hypothetical protein